jgi:NAD(P)H dehydrogenase (quinone)
VSMLAAKRGRRFLVVICHPVPNSFVRVVAERAITSLRANNHEVEVLDLDELQFDPCLTKAEWAAGNRGEAALDGPLIPHVQAVRSATDLVLVYPTWYGSMPAKMKGWFDRVWGRGVAWDLAPENVVPRPLLRNITNIWVLTSHGSSRPVNWLQGEAGRHFLRRTLRLTCSRRCRTHWIAMYGNDVRTDTDRRAFLDRVAQRFSKL